jgi:hypothetical protein
MSIGVKVGLWASSAILAVLATTFSANASCKLPGTWHYSAEHGSSSGQVVISCTFDVNSQGVVTSHSDCVGHYQDGSSNGFSLSSGSTLAVDSSCHLTGIFDSNTLPYTVSIDGYINGDTATAIGISSGTDNPSRFFVFIKLK